MVKNKIEIFTEDDKIVSNVKQNKKIIAIIPKNISLPKDYKKDLWYFFENSIYYGDRIYSVKKKDLVFENFKNFEKKYPHRFYRSLFMEDTIYGEPIIDERDFDIKINRCGICGYPLFYSPWISEYRGGDFKNELIHTGEIFSDTIRCLYCGGIVNNDINKLIFSYKNI